MHIAIVQKQGQPLILATQLLHCLFNAFTITNVGYSLT